MRRFTDGEMHRAAQVHREFGASMLGSSVEKDGQVKGWRDWYNALHPELQEIYDTHAKHAAKCVVDRGESMDSVIARATVSFRHRVQTFRPLPRFDADPSEIASLTSILGKALKWSPDEAEAVQELKEMMAEDPPTEFIPDDPTTYGYGLGPNGE